MSRLRPAIVREAIEGDRRGYRLTRSASTDLEEIGDLVASAAAHQRSGSPARAATPVQRALALLDRGPLTRAIPMRHGPTAPGGCSSAPVDRRPRLVGGPRRNSVIIASPTWRHRRAPGQAGRSEATYQRLARALHDELGAQPGASAHAERERIVVSPAPPSEDGPPLAPVGRTRQLDALRTE